MAESIAFITGGDRGLGFSLCKGLLARGWRVFAGQYMHEWTDLDGLVKLYPQLLTPIALDVTVQDSVQAAASEVAKLADHVDVLINNAGVISMGTNERTIRDGQDYGELYRVFDVNAVGPIRVMEAFMPLLERSQVRRLCFVSSESGSIGRCERTTWYGYNMSKTALNMAVKIMFNDLRPQGYTFRLYHPGWMRTYMSGKKNTAADLEPDEAAVPALSYFLSGIGAEPSAVNEDVLVMRDNLGRDWPW